MDLWTTRRRVAHKLHRALLHFVFQCNFHTKRRRANSRTGIQMNLRPSGFDRNEAWLFAEMGCSSLTGSKLAKFAKKPKDEQERQLNNLVLTKKGQDLFALIKRVGLQAPGKGSYLI